jgi:hypothetical protein
VGVLVTHEQRIAVVVPVFRGERTLPGLVDEVLALPVPGRTRDGVAYRITEVILVDDRGPDGSAAVIRDLARAHDRVTAVRLARNSGQHGATLAGIAASSADWVVTMDEDGLHDPADIPGLLDAAFAARARLVYAVPINRPPHGPLRNAASRIVKRLARAVLMPGREVDFSSFRLMHGDLVRALARDAGPNLYLDAALDWVVADPTGHPVELRSEGRPAESYSFRRLRQHFWRLVLSSGTRPLRLIAFGGATFALAGIAVAAVVIWLGLRGGTGYTGWASTLAAVLVVGGVLMLVLAALAGYLAIVYATLMGRRAFVAIEDDDGVFAR